MEEVLDRNDLPREIAAASLAAPDYRRAWRLYRRRRNLALLLLFGWIPFSLAALGYVEATQHEPLLALIPILLWGLVMALAVWYAGEFRCPRCRRRFGAVGSKKGVTLIFRGLFDPICYNCKLRKFENG